MKYLRLLFLFFTFNLFGQVTLNDVEFMYPFIDSDVTWYRTKKGTSGLDF